MLEQAREALPEEVMLVAAQFEDENGYVSKEQIPDAIAAVAEHLEAAKAEGNVLYCEKDENGVCYVDAARSELWVWTPPQKDLLSASSTIAQSSILTLGAFHYGKDIWGKTINKALRKYRAIKVVSWRVNFPTDAIADFEGLLAVNREICKQQMSEKAPPDVPPYCAVFP